MVVACAVSVVALVVLAACGGSSSSSGGTSSSGAATTTQSAGGQSSSGAGANLQACTAFSQSDASTITGDSGIAALGTNGGTTASGPGTCVYADETPSGAGNSAVVVIEPAGQVSAAIIQMALQQQEKNGSGNFQSISGIGDTAYSETDAHGAGIAFAKSNTLVVVAASSSTKSGADVLSALQSVASRIAGQV